MSRLKWDGAGQRRFETGVDQGVLYLEGGIAVPWSGLTSISEGSSGGEPKSYYLDGVNYINVPSTERFSGTIEAFTYPSEFSACEGTVHAHPGFAFGQQRRVPFGLSYRTQVGNDVEGIAYGYKIHIVYDALVAPSERAYATASDSPEAVTFSWNFTTTPVDSGAGYAPVAHITVDSTEVTPEFLQAVEDRLYGSETENPRLPSPLELLELYASTQDIPNIPPVADFTTVMTDLTVEATGSASDTDGSIIRYVWQFGDGESATGAQVTHTYATSGDYTITLTVTDDDNATNTVLKNVTAIEPVIVTPNVPPTASFNSTASNLALSVVSTSSDSDGSIVSTDWDFGDGNTASGPTAGHNYAAAGEYIITLTVTDDNGAASTASKNIVVTEPSAEPDPTPDPTTMAVWTHDTLYADVLVPDLTVSKLLRNDGIDPVTSSPGYSTDPVARLGGGGGQYAFNFTLTPTEGKAVNVVNLKYKAAAGGTGVRGINWRYSVDDGVTWTIIHEVVSLPTVRPNWTTYNIPVSISHLGPVKLRVTCTVEVSHQLVEYDDVELVGYISDSAAPEPEPPTDPDPEPEPPTDPPVTDGLHSRNMLHPYWTTKINSAPLASTSADFSNRLNLQWLTRPFVNGAPQPGMSPVNGWTDRPYNTKTSQDDFTMPIYVVPRNQPRQLVYSSKHKYISGVYDLDDLLLNGVPLPDPAQIMGGRIASEGSDASCIILQDNGNGGYEVWEFIGLLSRADATAAGTNFQWGGQGARYIPDSYNWRCSQAGHIADHRLHSGWWASPPDLGVSAAGHSYLGSTLKYEDYLAGVINHPVGLSLSVTGSANGSPTFILPAERGDIGNFTNSAASVNDIIRLPEGARFRLKASVDIDAWVASKALPTNSTTQGSDAKTLKMVMVMLRDYGLIINDRAGGIMGFSAEGDKSFGSPYGVAQSPFTWGDFGQQLPWNQFEQIKVPPNKISNYGGVANYPVRNQYNFATQT